MRTLRLSILLLLLHAPGRADDLEQARRAIGLGLPQAAIPLLRDEIEASGAAQNIEARVLLGRALLEANRPVEAHAALAPVTDHEEASFWLAQAEAVLGKFHQALEIYNALANLDPSEWQDAARLGAATMLQRLGRPDEALQRLEGFPDGPFAPQGTLLRAECLLELGKVDEARAALAAEEPSAERPLHRRLLEARLALGEQKLDAARRAFEELARIAAGRDPRISAEAAIGEAMALEAAGGNSDAERVLEHFIDRSPANPKIGAVFSQLDLLYAADRTVTNSQLEKWVGDETENGRRALALFYLARNFWRAGERGSATDTMQRFIREYSLHPLRAEASELLARWFLEEDEPQYALNVLLQFQEARSELSLDADLLFLRGRTLAALNRFAEAANDFRRVARSSPELREVASRNARLLDLRVGRSLPESNAEFDFASALELARQRDPAAHDTILRLIDQLEGSQRIDLLLALAELDYLEGRREAAKHGLIRVANEAGTSPSQEARADYLQVFIEDASAEQVLQAAQAFLSTHPGSLFEPEVRLKLGEVLFQRGDYTAARLQLATAARQTGEPSLREVALFLAGKAAERELSDRSRDEALGYFEEVAELGGRLASRARLEQALIKAAQGRKEEAITILEQLTSDPEADPYPFDAGLRTADIRYEQAETPEAYAEVAERFAGIAELPEVPTAVRNEAWTKAGVASEKAGKIDEALAFYHRVIDTPQEGEPDYFWFYKAGFEAGRLLEERKLFKEAVAVYEKISATEGPRASEASERVNRLRLENFLWDSTP